VKRILQFIFTSLAALLLTLFLGCSRSPAPVADPAPEANVAAAPATTSNPSAAESTPATSVAASPPAANNPSATSIEKVKFKLDGGDEAFSLKFKADGAKLEDAGGAELARLKVDETRKIKIKDANDNTLGYVITQAGYWKLENAEQTQELFVLRRQADGDYKLETAADQPVYRIKTRDYGFEIETPQKQSLYKVKMKGEKLSLRDANENTVLYTKSTFLPIALACFGFDQLSREQQAALAYAVNASGGQ